MTGVEIGSDFAAVQALPKANFLIDECISDAAYLNLCAMRTLIPRDPDVLQFFRAAQLGSGTQSEVQRWIVAKLINSVSMMSLCLEISEAQRLRYEKHGMAQLSVGREREIVGRSIHEGLFSLFNNLAVTVRDEFANIIRASEQNPVIDSKAIVRSLSSYLAETQS